MKDARDPSPPRKRVLVVEDHAMNQQLARLRLTRGGCEVELAQTGCEAIEAVRRAPYDLILMDVQMPEMDGYTATREIRALEAGTGRRTPIVALTARALKGDRERCLEAGMDDYLTKPVDGKELMDTIMKWTEGTPGEGAQGAQSGIVDRLKDLGLWDDQAMALEILRDFTRDAEEAFEGLRRAADGRDARAVERLAHRLRGASLNVGHEEMARTAAALEERCRAGDPGPLDEVCTALKTQLEVVARLAGRLEQPGA